MRRLKRRKTTSDQKFVREYKVVSTWDGSSIGDRINPNR